MRGSLKAYKSVAVDSQKNVASPYKVVQMLLAGVLERLAKARAAAEQNDIARRGELVGSAISIISELQGALDQDAGGDIAANLDNIYDYAVRELLLANAENDGNRIETVSRLIREIKEAWDAIPPEQQALPE
ncbi:flagellar export chaperone FliS [Zobellella denitrificans]|jgi:flagellar protein FliS|uniref:flagellar export chaperone FliS n=1 Tax=Zobellella denitrificans TaxID=347534 RepID=UPI000B8C417F|nr:flagellar export chaperone FliS [Zobellella denitrificans]OXS14046.1 flagellar export chaperone FliS [Zobellella denitrificans]